MEDDEDKICERSFHCSDWPYWYCCWCGDDGGSEEEEDQE